MIEAIAISAGAGLVAGAILYRLYAAKVIAAGKAAITSASADLKSKLP